MHNSAIMPGLIRRITRGEIGDLPMYSGPADDNSGAPPYGGPLPHYEPLPQYEPLPTYRTALTKFGGLKCKREMATPFEKAKSRKWMPAHVTINGTQLQITTGKVLKHCRVFSLQCARVGLATDYDKSPYCLRLRVEAQQYIFAMQTLKELFEWMLALQMGIDLAMPLDLRQMPEVTRNRRQRRRRTKAGRETREARDTRENGARRGDVPGSEASVLDGTSGEMSDARGCFEHGKWAPRTERRAPACKDFAKLLDNEPWTGQVHLHRGKWALVTESRMIYA